MSFTKQDIYNALDTITEPGEGKSLVENKNISNLVVFGNEVIVDVAISNPTLQAKKKVESEIKKAILSKVDEKIDVKVNVKTSAAPKKEEKSSLIKGKKIPSIKNIIAIASGKGGVGKSTITANMAVSLSKMGFKVGILDADIYGPSMHLMFDVEKERPISVKIEGRSKMKPIENYGVKLLSLGFFTNPNQAVIWRGPMASKALNQLIFDADWGELDFLLIDLPPGTGDVHLSIVQALPINGAVIVSTPQTIALADAKKGVAMFQQESIQVPVLGIIENMAYFTPEELPDNKYYIFGKEGAKGLAEQMEIDLLAEIPIVQSVREAADAGRPAVLQGATPIAIELLNMAKNVVTAIEKRNTTLAPTKAVELTNSKGCSTK